MEFFNCCIGKILVIKFLVKLVVKRLWSSCLVVFVNADATSCKFDLSIIKVEFPPLLNLFINSYY